MPFDTIIFDLGNVLINWSPSHLYDKIFVNPKERDYFLSTICNMAWHSEQDAGRNVLEATEEKANQHPAYEAAIRAYYSRWKEMFNGPIDGSVKILAQLKTKGYQLYALTNWNADLYKETEMNYPFLHWFDGMIISGEVRLKKPDAAIYHTLLSQYQVNPSKALFIDDNLQNIEAARNLGIHSIQFINAEQLETDLKQLAIL